MDKTDKKLCKAVEDLDATGIIELLEKWDMNEFVDFVTEKQVDGRKLLDVTEGIVKLWRPKVNAKKFISFIEELRLNPNKYFGENPNDTEEKPKIVESVESQYQTVIRKKSKEENPVAPTNSIEELLKRIVPAKSFLYRNHPKELDKTVPSYLPMSGSSSKKGRKLFRLSSYDYPIFDLRTRSSKDVCDRGYYPMKRNSIFYLNKSLKKPEARTKYKSLGTPEELTEKYQDDHFYEDLCYNEIEQTSQENVLRNSVASPITVKPCIVKFHNLFKNFKIPFFKRTEEVVEDDKRVEVSDKESNIYENGDCIANMYDSVHVNTENDGQEEKDKTKLPVEDYLEPVQVTKDYLDVQFRQRDDSILGYIMSIFENRFGLRREANVAIESEESDTESQKTTGSPEADRWSEKKNKSMVDRPLPVPVENESYYMNIDRTEAENLLRGQPDGMFVLRPSSQATHAYTLTVSCSGAVHNVGVRRRQDGRLALGFARRGERTFTCISSLLRHHRKRRLLLVAEVDEQSTSTVDADAANAVDNEPDNKNGQRKMLRRLDTVPDIKRDTSGITTQYIATGIVNLGALAAGACVAWSSTALPLMRAAYEEAHSTKTSELMSIETSTAATVVKELQNGILKNEYEASWVASLLCLGAFWGSVPAGLISEYFGRKKTLLYLALPLVISWILVASSPNLYGLYVGRFVGGIAVGAFSVSIPPYVEDIAEEQTLKTLANFYHVHFSCGILFGYIIGLVENPSWLSVLCASIPVAFFVAYIFLPESPAYLMSQGKAPEAKAALRYYRGIDNDIDGEIRSLREFLRNSAKTRVTFKELFCTRAPLKAIIVSFGLMIFQQFSGIYPVLFYARTIFSTFAISLNPPSAAIILGFCLVSSTYFSTMLLKIARRRLLLLISFSMMALNLGGLAIYYQYQFPDLSSNSTWVPLFTLCLFVSFYAAGVGPIPWLMLREIFPPHLTRRATAITAGFHWLLAFAVTKLYQNLEDLIQPGWTFLHFSVSCVIGTIFVYFFVPETKGRTLQEIQNEFEGIHKKKRHRHVIEVESVSEA